MDRWPQHWLHMDVLSIICSTPTKNIAEHVNIVFVGAEQVPRTLLVLKKYQHPCGPFLIRHVVPEF